MTVVLDSAARRGVDLVLASLGLVFTTVPMAVIALLIRVTSRGPAIFRQVRLGRGGKPFTLYKFRSMRVTGSGPAVSGEADPRITSVGRWLRERRLDELPQLVNLLRGDMTLIGPRPEVAKFVEHYTPEEMRTLDVRPGIIGPGAILFARELAAELDEIEDPDAHYIDHQLHPKLAHDLAYLRSRSVSEDLSLLMRALRVAGRGET